MMIDEFHLSKEIDHLCASSFFSNKPQMKRLLEHLVSHLLTGDERPYDQRSIAMDGLGRGDDFDPAENPLVRIEVGRLRRLLHDFYDADQGRPFKINIPLRQYRPEIIPLIAETSSTPVLPDLRALSVKEERLTVLLQFSSKGDESAGLYLLRHQIRIGFTLQIKQLEGIRLVIAIPSVQGAFAARADVIMKVSLSQQANSYVVRAETHWVGESDAFSDSEQMLTLNYDQVALESRLAHWVSDLFDLEIGLAWGKWIQMNQGCRDYPFPSMAKAALLYLSFLRKGGERLFTEALAAAKAVVEQNQEPQITRCILVDLYYLGVLHGYGVVDHLLGSGVGYAGEALRSNPGCPRMHTTLAALSYFTGQDSLAELQFRKCMVPVNNIYSNDFHQAILKCLAFDWQQGFERLDEVVRPFDRYPDLYAAMAYINAFLGGDQQVKQHWRSQVISLGCVRSVQQLIRLMRYPEQIGWSGERDALSALVAHDLSVK